MYYKPRKHWESLLSAVAAAVFHFFFEFSRLLSVVVGHHCRHRRQPLSRRSRASSSSSPTTLSLHPHHPCCTLAPRLIPPAPATTRNASRQHSIPLSGPLPPATRPGRSGRTPASPVGFGSSTPARDPPPHLASSASGSLPRTPPPPPPPRPRNAVMPSTKLDLPSLVSPVSPSSVNAWLDGCEDAFEVFTTMNPTTDIKVSAQITMVGLKMVAPEAAQWWNENRAAMKALTTYAKFVTKVREHFTPSGWKMDALATFYATRQGKLSFADFVTAAQTARGVLGTAGPTWKITDSMFKNHLLFHCHRLLSLRVRAIPYLGYDSLKVDSLINTMSLTWNSMLAEGIVRQESLPPVIGNPSRSGANGLSVAERADLRAAGGCFHCRKTPLSPGWKAHSSKTCPGDPTRNIPPAPTPVIAAAVGALPVNSDVDSEHEYADAEYDTDEFRELVMREDEESD
ncbi:hypothetical protein BKA70DRAFT_1408594 [Coprinopsis sp. MPI-PUGE-AT-0042]|nr:hypothetical protein BKA70DRAFT_1408594 [Coprinopsis sp. MPI-PUGE-AT-0042]